MKIARVISAAAALLVPSMACANNEPAADMQAVQAAPVSDAELAMQRGGFVWNGVDVQLGVEIRSYLRDELVMQTNIAWTAGGAQRTQFVSGALTPAGADNLRAGLANGAAITMQAGNGTVFLANEGQTAFIHRSDGAFQNIVVNTASQSAIRQELDVRLDVANFGPLEASSLAGRINSGLADMINGAITGAGRF